MASEPRAAEGRRADARRNRVAILQAATTCLARDPDVSLNEIAKAAGVGRVTLYGHFESRAALVEAVADHAIAQTESDLSSVDLTGDTTMAMARLMLVTWDLTYRFGALVVAAQRVLPPQRIQALHEAPASRVRQLLKRGRRSGAFADDMPLAWQVSVIQSILHGGTEVVYRGELEAAAVRELVAATVIAALERRTNDSPKSG